MNHLAALFEETSKSVIILSTSVKPVNISISPLRCATAAGQKIVTIISQELAAGRGVYIANEKRFDLMESIDERVDKWLNDLEEADALKRFLISGITVILCLGLVGILISKPYVSIAIYLLIEVGVLPNGVIPFFVVDVLRCLVAFVLCFLILLMFLVRLETTFLRLR